MIFNHFGGKTSVRTQQYRLDAAGRLFDMQSDPGQWHDIAAREARRSPAVVQGGRRLAPRRAGRRRARTSRPFPVGYAAFPTTFLPARDGIASGGVKRSAGAPNCSYFTNWREHPRQDHLGRRGGHRAAVTRHCSTTPAPRRTSAATVELSFRGNRVQGQGGPGQRSAADQHHGSRAAPGESYMKDFRPLRLGEIQLEKGRGLLTLRATDIPGKQVMDLWTVVLKLAK